MLEFLGLDRQAEAVYRWMLAHPATTCAELVTHLGGTEEDINLALDQLSTLALVGPTGSGLVHAVRAEIGLKWLMDRKQADLAALQQQLEISRVAAAHLISESTGLTQDTGHQHLAAEHLVGKEAIRIRIAELAGQLTQEFMGLTLGESHCFRDLEEVRSVDRRMLERGIRMRAVWQDSIRNDSHALEYAEWFQSLGGQARTVPTLPIQMIIMDREYVVLLPMSTADSEASAVVIHCHETAAALCTVFEAVWKTATGLGALQPLDRHGLTPREGEFLRLLVLGLTDQAVAARLGVSHRTARRIAAALMEKLCARSRFEAGFKAAALGWLLPDE
ncbi:LuxR C-terminal-related transcriptional regulator [Streptomyces sp. FH025]|uniref:LuxR C-terminal-related transcriptional regulator n=1 Tax=Streptomyces sp. FH025 TaxID=2815937 RepID=UPI001A9CC37B|nr:LuxR C-terminal-related transcriptional regulator [Streptomyces sp. FH025]MBO1413746.1 helix-turn-helix transcriptional regulator [Streptomyces sp. FH025]